MADYCLSIDLGGTKIALGLYDHKINCKGRLILPTKAHKGPEFVISRIKNGVANILDQVNLTQKDIAVIGLGAPGPIDSTKGLIRNPPNLPGWHDIPIVKILKSEYGVPVILENDANAAVYGEWIYGEGKGVDDFIYITVSTGIGGGAIINGKLLRGQSGNGTELGHMTINFIGPDCMCQNNGCWEAYASGTALARFAREGILSNINTQLKNIAVGKDIKAEHVFECAKVGDEFAKKLISDECFYLGVGLANVANIFNSEIIAIGGGLSKQWEVIYEPMVQVMKTRAMAPNTEKLQIKRAKLGADVGIIGAAKLAWEYLE